MHPIEMLGEDTQGYIYIEGERKLGALAYSFRLNTDMIVSGLHITQKG